MSYVGAELAVVFATIAPQTSPQSAPPLAEVARVELTGVGGRIDHLAWDAKHRRLWVAAMGNGSVEIVEWSEASAATPPTGRVIKSLRLLAEPQGVAWLEARDEVAFTTGGDGHLHVFDAGTLAPLADLRVGGEADNVRFDAKAGVVWVGCDEGLVAVDVAARKKVATVKLAGHAESFQLEPDGARIFVNVPDAQQVAVVDRVERKVVATWPIAAARSNFPMAVDAAAGRVLVGCRSPAKLLALDAASGALKQELPIGSDVDDLFVDAAHSRVYAACGAGEITVLSRDATGTLAASTSIATVPGARTALFVPDAALLFLAAPARDGKPATIVACAAR